MAVFSTIKFHANTVDGDIMNAPVSFDLQCKLVRPIGSTIIRQFNNNECIRAIRVFLIYYEGQNLGTTQFKTMDEFIKYLNNTCNPVKDCGLIYLGCPLTVNGCQLKYIK